MSTLRLAELNSVMISGRLTRDADNRMTQNGQAICSFDVAVNRRYLDNASGEWKDDVTFVPVTVFGPAAERVKERLKKGTPVMVEGRLSSNEYVDKAGQTRKVLRITSRRVQVLQSAGEGGAGFKDSAEPADIAEDDVPF